MRFLVWLGEPGLELFRWLYLYVGAIDDHEEGDVAFWRWDIWNSRAIGQRIELERQAV